MFSDSLPDFAGIDVSNPNCVVLGDSQHEFTYDNLNKAFRVLMGLDKPILFALGGGLVTYEPPRGKTYNVVSEQVRHKSGCTVTEAG